MAYVFCLYSISQTANDCTCSVPFISNKSNESLLWMNSMAEKLQWTKVQAVPRSVLLQQRIYFTLLSPCYIYFGWITHGQLVILFFKMMLKLRKKWKLTKFSAPSAALCVASVMVNYKLGGGQFQITDPKTILEKSKNWQHSPLQFISGNLFFTSNYSQPFNKWHVQGILNETVEHACVIAPNTLLYLIFSCVQYFVTQIETSNMMCTHFLFWKKSTLYLHIYNGNAE